MAITGGAPIAAPITREKSPTFLGLFQQLISRKRYYSPRNLREEYNFDGFFFP